MSEGLRGDTNGHIMQCFGAKRFQAVVTATPWSPSEEDRIFVVPEACTYTMESTTGIASLQAGALRAIHGNKTYTFDTDMVLEIL